VDGQSLASFFFAARKLAEIGFRIGYHDVTDLFFSGLIQGPWCPSGELQYEGN
jgi:hypothetical protein